MSNILQRSITGTVYVGLIAGSLLYHPLFFVLLTSIMNFFALKEFETINKKEKEVSKYWIFISSIAFIISNLLLFLGYKPSIAYAPLLLLFISLLIISLYQKQNNNNFLSNSVFSTAYITLPLLLLNQVHLQSETAGISIVLVIFIFIWINDSFAFLFGITFGKHRLFERISPKKSWEGFFGGFLATLLFAFFWSKYNQDSISMYHWLIISALTAVASVYGDLIESLIKRRAGVKDSGNLLPGHGGMLDRIDSLLLVSPVIYIYLLFL